MGDIKPQHYCNRCLTSFEGDPDRCPNLGCGRAKPSTGWGTLHNQGDVIDRNYRILDKLALGGAGVTYLAQELGPDGAEGGPKLAIKVLFANRDHGPYLRRLATEAQILQELDHPNIVQYMGFVHRAGHSPYLITRFEQGGSLLDHIKRSGRLPVRVTAQIGRQICWALAMAHKRNVIHRDLKPENVLLAERVPREQDPIVRVADFGIAKVEGSLASGLTRIGAFVGTPQYAAPEQFAGGKPSELTDVYGVGAILYFCLTARSVIAFGDRQTPEESHQMLTEALPPRFDRTDEPPEDVRRMNLVFASAMHPSPDKRCRLDTLDLMLEAVVAGRDPIPPVVDIPLGPVTSMGEGEEISQPIARTHDGRPAAEATKGAFADTTVAAQRPPAEPLPVAAVRSNPTLASMDATDEEHVGVPPVPTLASPAASAGPSSSAASPVPTLAGETTAPEASPAAPRSSGGSWLRALGVVVVLGFVAVAAGGAWFLQHQRGASPQVDPPPDPPPTPADPVAVGPGDPTHDRLHESLVTHWAATVAQCHVPMGSGFTVHATVLADGRVSAFEAEPSSGTPPELGTCVADAYRAVWAPPAPGGSGVRVDFALSW